jgi:hypothetical protein
VAAVENARDFGALALRIGDAVQMRRVFEYLPDVRIGEAADHVLAARGSSVRRGRSSIRFRPDISVYIKPVIRCSIAPATRGLKVLQSVSLLTVTSARAAASWSVTGKLAT